MRKQRAFLALTGQEIEQLADWLRREPCETVLDRVNKPRTKGFGLNISKNPLQTFGAKVMPFLSAPCVSARDISSLPTSPAPAPWTAVFLRFSAALVSGSPSPPRYDRVMKNEDLMKFSEQFRAARRSGEFPSAICAHFAASKRAATPFLFQSLLGGEVARLKSLPGRSPRPHFRSLRAFLFNLCVFHALPRFSRYFM